MAGWQAGLVVLVQSVLQQLHVVLPANTAANNLQTGYRIVATISPLVFCNSITQMDQLHDEVRVSLAQNYANRSLSACYASQLPVCLTLLQSMTQEQRVA